MKYFEDEFKYDMPLCVIERIETDMYISNIYQSKYVKLKTLDDIIDISFPYYPDFVLNTVKKTKIMAQDYSWKIITECCHWEFEPYYLTGITKIFSTDVKFYGDKDRMEQDFVRIMLTST